MQAGKAPSVSAVLGQVGTWETRIRYGEGRRKRFIIRHCRTEEAARERAKEMVEIAEKLVASGKTSEVETILEAAGAAENLTKLTVVRNLVRRICSGAYDGRVRLPSKLPESISLREFGSLWVDGELNRMWPDHVEVKRTAADDAWRMRKHIFPIIGDLSVKDVTLDDVDHVMASLPRNLSKASRRHVAQILVRLMHLATYPARLRPSSPIPRGWLPKLRKKVNYPILLPAEDAALLRETSVPLHRRLVYGFLHREGLRRGDAERLCWRQIDFAFGTLRIESDKTNHARLFLLDPGVVAALVAWKERKGSAGPDDLVFTDDSGKLPDMDHLAAQLRRDLQRAGVVRRELFEAHGNWGRLNVHTLRHSYVTRSLARGVPEDAVRQRTGHLSNELRRYREFANSIAELKLEDLVPLNEAIPELAGVGHNVGQDVGQVEKRLSLESEKRDENSRLLN